MNSSYLRKAIDAPRCNINRCFQELDFFGHIPSTCEPSVRRPAQRGSGQPRNGARCANVSIERVELSEVMVWELWDEIRMRIISGIGVRV